MTARLEDLTPGTRVSGITPAAPVEVVQATWHGTSALTLTYRTPDGRVAEQLVYRDMEPQLAVEQASRIFSFTANPALFRLAAEAKRIQLAYLFDPMLAVSTSQVVPLPHQIQAVYGELLTRQPMRFLLADDPGAGKTIMAGLFIKELIIRGDLKRCLIVAPGSLVEQWQDELWVKFGLDFDIISRETVNNSKSGNPFAEREFAIGRLDHMARNEDIRAKLEQTEWDLIVCDEAHKMSAHYFGNEVKRTKRYELGVELGRLTRHLLLMTATPHSGSQADFQLFMALLDGDRFEGRPRDGQHSIDTQGMMRRLVKEKLLKFDGTPLFPERRAYTVKYELSDAEAALYTAVTDYVREEMNRVERLKAKGEGRRGAIVGFALTTLQRRLASSPEAIYQSIKRRRERLERQLAEAELRKRSITQVAIDFASGLPLPDDFEEDLDEYLDGEIEQIEDEVIDQATAAATVEELKAEIATLARLEAAAREVRASGTDRKWEQLASLLTGHEAMFWPDGSRRKIIVFSEHKDTLTYLVQRIRTLLGRDEAVVAIHGGMGREDRRKVQELFTQDKDVSVLVATDAAGEGINLQRANLLVNYDLPWNPNRIEQRFGRIHRIGQTEVCHMWNLVADKTREGDVFLRLFQKLEKMRESLGGQVYDVLGQVFTEKPLRDLLIEAVRYGEQPEVKAKLDEVIDHTVGDTMNTLIHERALASDVLSAAEVERIREEMELAEARRLQPHFIRAFFIEAFTRLGGRIVEREPGRFEVKHVPADIRARDRVIGKTVPVLSRYERVTFEKERIHADGHAPAQFICPGHPLLDATVDLAMERFRTLLKEGALLVDELDPGTEPRLLLFLESSIQDGRLTAAGTPTLVSRRLQFVELTSDGSAADVGYAPYLDYRPATPEEAALVSPSLDAEWLGPQAEALGVSYAVEHIVPAHFAEVQHRTLDRVARTREAVRQRLTHEINYWDYRAEELKAQELAGKTPRLNSAKARQRADELQARLQDRLLQLDREAQLSPLQPVVVGGAVVIPAGMLASAAEGPPVVPPVSADPALRKEVERIAVDAVLTAERALGREPEEMPPNNKGFDIRSRDRVRGHTQFIEVKGRVEGADTVTLTKNEILTALNQAENHILALVTVADSRATDVRYVRDVGALYGATQESLFMVASVNFKLDELLAHSSEPN
ncbi:MAG: helicase-related protein [Coriobacteriia bacterium]